VIHRLKCFAYFFRLVRIRVVKPRLVHDGDLLNASADGLACNDPLVFWVNAPKCMRRIRDCDALKNVRDA
jgi:hypothetical protein